MKYISLILNLFVLCVCLVALSNCDDNPTETEPQRVTRLLTTGGTWNLQSVTVDGVDRTSTYQGLKVSFSANNFSVTSGGAVWPASGTWSLTDDGKTITRNDGLTIAITELTEIRLVIALTWTKTTFGPGRVESVSGQHVFTFSR